jgi:hypothetical protein
MTKDTDSYEVGYGRPPKHTRFPPGQSGNRAGRRRKRLSNPEIVAKVRDELITMTINGEKATLSLFEAAVRLTLNATLKKGNPRDLEKLLKLLEKYGGLPADVEAEKARKGAAEVIDKIMLSFRRTRGITEENTADRRHREQEEVAILKHCACCNPLLQERWAAEEITSDRRRTRLREQFEDGEITS